MKKIFALVMLASFALAAPAFAVARSTSWYALNFTGPNLTTAPVELFSAAQVVKAVKGISVVNTASAPVVLDIGPSGSELSQVIIPASQAVALYLPFVASQNTRISLSSSTGTISSGAFQITLFYN